MSEIQMECLLIQTSVEDHGRIRKHSGIWVFVARKKKTKKTKTDIAARRTTCINTEIRRMFVFKFSLAIVLALLS